MFCPHVLIIAQKIHCANKKLKINSIKQLTCVMYCYIVFTSKGEKYMRIILNNSSMVPIYEQLMDQIKNQIINEELKENEALPSVRALSGDLKISALTVKKAYDKLEEEGFVTTIHGKGTFVSAADMSMAAEARRKAVEDEFASAYEKAKAVGMSKEEIMNIIEILLED